MSNTNRNTIETTFTLDGEGRVRQSARAGRVELQSYDRSGLPITATDARGAVSTNGYDAAVRLTYRMPPAPSEPNSSSIRHFRVVSLLELSRQSVNQHKAAPTTTAPAATSPQVASDEPEPLRRPCPPACDVGSAIRNAPTPQEVPVHPPSSLSDFQREMRCVASADGCKARRAANGSSVRAATPQTPFRRATRRAGRPFGIAQTRK